MRIHKFSRDTPDIVYLVVYSYIIKVVITFDLGLVEPRLEDLFGHGDASPIITLTHDTSISPSLMPPEGSDSEAYGSWSFSSSNPRKTNEVCVGGVCYIFKKIKLTDDGVNLLRCRA